jgi:hypothetical protein
MAGTTTESTLRVMARLRQSGIILTQRRFSYLRINQSFYQGKEVTESQGFFPAFNDYFKYELRSV